MNKSRDKMIAALCEVVLPTLHEMGFSGSFPHFRRARESQIDLLTFQFNRNGGSFLVEIACCSSERFTTYWGKHISPKKLALKTSIQTNAFVCGRIYPNKKIAGFVMNLNAQEFMRM